MFDSFTDFARRVPAWSLVLLAGFGCMSAAGADTGAAHPAWSEAVLRVVVKGRPVDEESPELWDTIGPVNSYPVAISPDGRLLAAAVPGKSGWEREARIWNLETGDEFHRLSADKDVLQALAFSPNGRTLAWGGYGRVHLWDVRTGEHQATATGYATNVTSLAFTEDGKAIAANGGRHVHLFDASTGEKVRDIPAHQGRVVAVSIAGDRMAITADWQIEIRNLETDEREYLIEEAGLPRSISLHPSGRYWSAVGHRSLQVWREERDQAELALKTERWGYRFSSHFSPDGKWLVVRGWRSFAILPFDVRYGRVTDDEAVIEFSPTRTPSGLRIPIGTAAFSPDGKTLVTSDIQGEVVVWDFARLTALYRMQEAARRLIGQQFGLPADNVQAADLEVERKGSEWIVRLPKELRRQIGEGELPETIVIRLVEKEEANNGAED